MFIYAITLQLFTDSLRLRLRVNDHKKNFPHWSRLSRWMTTIKRGLLKQRVRSGVCCSLRVGKTS